MKIHKLVRLFVNQTVEFLIFCISMSPDFVFGCISQSDPRNNDFNSGVPITKDWVNATVKTAGSVTLS